MTNNSQAQPSTTVPASVLVARKYNKGWIDHHNAVVLFRDPVYRTCMELNTLIGVISGIVMAGSGNLPRQQALQFAEKLGQQLASLDIHLANAKPHFGDMLDAERVAFCHRFYQAAKVYGTGGSIEELARLVGHINPLTEHFLILKEEFSPGRPAGMGKGRRLLAEHLAPIPAKERAAAIIELQQRLAAKGEDFENEDEEMLYETVSNVKASRNRLSKFISRLMNDYAKHQNSTEMFS